MNPYRILNVSQDANKIEILQAFAKARKLNATTKQFSGPELILAQKALLDPAKRLAADILLPHKQTLKRPKILPLFDVKEELPIDLGSNPFDTLQDDINTCLNL